MHSNFVQAHGPKRYMTPKDIVRRGLLSCVTSPSETEGPYYVSGMPYRADITESRPGIPMTLYITILDLSTCLAANSSQNVTVEIWHCDFAGIYSHYEEASKNVQNPKTDSNIYFRGKVFANSTGMATFNTIYPGWYTGRDVHIHVRIWQGTSLRLTSQFSFDDNLTAKVGQIYPYTANTNQRTYLSSDNVFKDNGVLGMLNIVQVDSSNMSAGFDAHVTMGVSLLANATSVSSASSSKSFPISTSIMTTAMSGHLFSRFHLTWLCVVMIWIMSCLH
ncbi:hypothetical protein C9374_002811 [Naegleria lovaniensis]|uniref:Intradiol ring-cleavage dioxygenases domain-containing protein n=1 Tax=Naegleria lovaniensis TaxID=51637 RepID=A0AA88KK47_NAELO|nr:uncharacterized protein C9374_002811 [Naegleria lovaniensis]KAG2386365.1 hypothetical protein C9374_002811 [Naegleria lovaniensis]